MIARNRRKFWWLALPLVIIHEVADWIADKIMEIVERIP